MTSLKIPQTDPRANYLAHAAEIDRAIAEVLDRGWYILGPQVSAFEQEFAAYLGVRHVFGVASGTDALVLALRACGIGSGDGVITVSHTAVATVAAIELAGAIPVLAEVDPATCTLDPNAVEDAIRRLKGVRVKAIIPVHLYGHPADMPGILDVAQRHGLRVVEDCAQSHGASIDGRKTGAWGHIAAFSFYPTKNLGALGDGGAVATDDPGLADRLRLLREYGWRERYVSETAGMNSRLDELQAAILRVKLRHLDDDNQRRRELAGRYTANLSGTSLSLPESREGCSHVYHQYVVQSNRRDDLRSRLRAAGIGSLIHYPVPVHLQPAYKDRLPIVAPLQRTEEIARKVLSLPMYPELNPDSVESAGRLISGVSRNHRNQG